MSRKTEPNGGKRGFQDDLKNQLDLQQMHLTAAKAPAGKQQASHGRPRDRICRCHVLASSDPGRD
ncbi:hypothetical protein [Mycolicibacterium gadium]|uniref:hypothetical protein n=1 Tax=Mycolicibacterium gadium TaxID=1794 RepID=UPI0013D8AD14|nr:hypothetical protein [Mycolicibacterium gadium]